MSVIALAAVGLIALAEVAVQPVGGSVTVNVPSGTASVVAAKEGDTFANVVRQPGSDANLQLTPQTTKPRALVDLGALAAGSQHTLAIRIVTSVTNDNALYPTDRPNLAFQGTSRTGDSR